LENVSANDDLDADAFEKLIEGPRVLGISIMNEILTTVKKPDVNGCHFSGYLVHDVLGGRRRDHRDMDSPRTDVNEKEHVYGDEPAVLPDLLGEEIGRGQDILVRCDEIMPGRPSKALERRLDAGFGQDILDGCPTDLIIKPPALPVRIHKALPFLRQPVHVPVPDPVPDVFRRPETRPCKRLGSRSV
jgi:hypothetical protein